MKLDSLLEKANRDHQTETSEVKVQGITLKILQIRDMAAYIERVVDQAPEGQVRLPYWAKIWEASLVLADYLLRLPEFTPGAPPRRVIELGAGLGLPGLFLAAAGHDVTLTDFEPEALLFARASALLNGLDRVRVRRLDWTKPDLEDECFDAVIGSELLYNQALYPHLARLLSGLRREGAQAYLAKGPAVPDAAYAARLRRDFELCEVRRIMRSNEERIRVSIYVLGRERAQGEGEGGSGNE
jgi:predicted nicotinamide N-methyase